MSGISIKPERTGFVRRGSTPTVTLKVFEDGGVRYGGKVVVTIDGIHLSFQNGADLSWPDLAVLNRLITEALQDLQAVHGTRSNTPS